MPIKKGEDDAQDPEELRETWTKDDVKQLKELARENTPTRVIGLKTGRTPESIYAKASEQGIPLKPTN